MRQAMVNLLTDAERYLITIRQAPTNRITRAPQAREVVLFEKDALDLTDRLDARLQYAREVNIVLIDKSRGTVMIEFPRRSWRVLTDGKDLRSRLIGFSDDLAAGARSWMFTYFMAWWLLAGPILLLVIVAGAWGASTTNQPGKAPPNPGWLNDFYKVSLFSIIPICWVVAIYVFIVLSFSGALGIWPKTFTLKTFTEGLYQVRIALFTPLNIAVLITATVAAIVGGVVATVIH